MILDLLSAYFLSILTAVLAALALAWVGIHLVARDLSLKSLVVGQATQIGVLFGILLFYEADWLVLLSGFIVGLVVYGVDLRLVKRFQFGKSSILLSIFIFLSALSHWLVAFFPGLEKHASQAYFGDVVTVTGFQLAVTAAVAALVIAYMARNHRNVLATTFDRGTYLLSDQDQRLLGHDRVFLGVAFVLVVTSIFSLGLIFTIGCLLIPTTVLNLGSPRNFSVHQVSCLVLALLGVFFGFLLSLYFEDFSTVPTILGAFVFLGLLGLLGIRGWGVEK